MAPERIIAHASRLECGDQYILRLSSISRPVRHVSLGYFAATDALANIEQYAIDLAWDIIARFADTEVEGQRLPVEFFLDWAKVAEDEAKHYSLLARRLHVSVLLKISR